MLIRTTGGLLSRTYHRYLAASLIALGVDSGLFLVLVGAGASAVVASATGYILGIVMHWLISTRFVFDGGMASSSIARVRQKSLFVATALVGLALTVGIVGLASHVGLDARLAKLVAVVVSFQATYMVRRATVFRP